MTRLANPLRLVPLGLLLGISFALAFDTSNLGQWGSLPLDDLAPIIAKSARLQQEISQVLSEGSKKQEGDVRWNALSGSVETSWPAPSITLRI